MRVHSWPLGTFWRMLSHRETSGSKAWMKKAGKMEGEQTPGKEPGAKAKMGMHWQGRPDFILFRFPSANFGWVGTGPKELTFRLDLENEVRVGWAKGRLRPRATDAHTAMGAGAAQAPPDRPPLRDSTSLLATQPFPGSCLSPPSPLSVLEELGFKTEQKTQVIQF